MKKLLFSALLCAALLLCCALPVYAVDEPIAVSDAETLRSMAGDPAGSYILTADIDMAGEDWTPFAFAGTLNGNGHAIYNLDVTAPGADVSKSVDGNLKEYDTLGVGLFSALNNATVRDLTLYNVKVSISSDQNCFAALLSGCVSNATVSNCSVLGSVELRSSGKMVGVGGIAGFGTADFSSCRAEVTLVHVDGNLESRCEQFTGGILACGYCTINDCTVDIKGYTSCHGYVHDGGLIGMHYQFFNVESPVIQTSKGNAVTGFITFFEDNADRRAYCEPYCGENLYSTMSLSTEENTQSFERQEVFDYSVTLLPHSCQDAAFTAGESVAPTCTDWGYTVYKCDRCDYSTRDDYQPPHHEEGDWEVEKDATLTESGVKVRKCTLCGKELERAEIAPHVPGDWVVSVEPGYGTPGLRQQLCTDCGAVLAEEELPALVRIESIALSESEVTVHYKSTCQLYAEISPDDATDPSLVWSSSDIEVASVDTNGLIFSRGGGECTITCTAADGGAVAECQVKVNYSFGQWLIRIFLLGFLWY